MGGINGILSLSGQRVDPDIICRMNHIMRHRGRNGHTIWCDEHVGLGHRHLYPVSSKRSKQPLTNEDGTIRIVSNGHITNERALREQLIEKGHRFRTAERAETIVHLYEQYGKQCVDYLEGAFSFIIWDAREKTLFAARDRFGIKPLYYTLDDEALRCSSELKSLLTAKKGANTLDWQSMLLYLTFQYVPAPRTMLAGVWKLPPAHRLIADGQTIAIERYWQPIFTPTKHREVDICQRIRTAFENAVYAQLPRHGRYGSFLSSGIDSTAIAAVMRKAGPLDTFSVGFHGDHNECPIARQTAHVLGTRHHEWLISEREYFAAVSEAVWFQDDPVADPSAIALYLLSRFASEHVDIVLSGEGADELFGGYRIYQEPYAIGFLKWLSQPKKDALRRAIVAMPHFYGKNFLLRATTPLKRRFIGNAKIFTDDIVDVIDKQFHHYLFESDDAFQWAEQYYDDVRQYDDMTKMQYIDLCLWLPGNILAKGDKMTMAHTLDMRLPFLNEDLFNIARTLPTKDKVTRWTTKHMLREAFRDLVPEHVLKRPKLGFPVPLRYWLSGQRGEQCIAFIRESGLASMINIAYVDQLFAEHRLGKADNSRKLWALYILAVWHNMFLENPAIALTKSS